MAMVSPRTNGQATKGGIDVRKLLVTHAELSPLVKGLSKCSINKEARPCALS